jgi:hypothetical protein
MYPRRPVLPSAVYDPTLDSITLGECPLPSMTTSQSRTHSWRFTRAEQLCRHFAVFPLSAASAVVLTTGARCTGRSTGGRCSSSGVAAMTSTGAARAGDCAPRSAAAGRGENAAGHALRAGVFPLCVDGREGRRGRNQDFTRGIWKDLSECDTVGEFVKPLRIGVPNADAERRRIRRRAVRSA